MTSPILRIEKVLIANRGEIACRVIKTCKRLGIASVAVYSDADAGSRHVRLADEAVHIGPSPARESYLLIANIIAAAQRTGAQAIHPGYGFLSENEAFAAACADAGLIFIGPPVSAIRAMGSKSNAKALMGAAGVPLTPGYHGDEQDPAFLLNEAAKIGYPVLIKASAGGGGKGMRRVNDADDFIAALASCKREAASSFGDDRVLLEKYLLRPRHIEIQVFGDHHGNVIHLFERDCSVQRRHQKVLEEAPAPNMTAERRQAMGEAACQAARAVGYVGAGTVEFIMDQTAAGTGSGAGKDPFYFMEMNTRLQVEHPVTEMITGLDLVEWQLHVAAGGPLPLKQEQLSLRGHAIEARIYAENPDKGFLPSTGPLLHLAPPAESPHVRIDTGVEQGDTITPFYDPMIAKLIVWDETREQALRRMSVALGEYRIVGPANNIEFLARLINTQSFANADLDTHLIEREADALRAPDAPVPAAAVIAATFARIAAERAAAGKPTADIHSPWRLRDGWRLNHQLRRMILWREGEQMLNVEVEYGEAGDGGRYTMNFAGTSYQVEGRLDENGGGSITLNGAQFRVHIVTASSRHYVFFQGHCHILVAEDPSAVSTDSEGAGNLLQAPMPGRIIAHLVVPGAEVAQNAPLLLMEAMKMETTILAPAAGIVKGFRFAVGEQVGDGDQLVDFESKV